MESYSCNIICGATPTVTVKGLKDERERESFYLSPITEETQIIDMLANKNLKGHV